MQVGPSGMARAINHRPSVIESGSSQAEIPTNINEGMLTCCSDPVEQRGKSLIVQQICLAMPTPLIGDCQPLGIVRLKLQNVVRPASYDIGVRVLKVPQRSWE